MLADRDNSGFDAELLELTAGPAAREGAWGVDVEEALATRSMLDAAAHDALRCAHG